MSFLDEALFSVEKEGYGASQAASTTKKDYKKQYAFINFTSHSVLNIMHECGRKYKLLKLRKQGTPAADKTFGYESELPNIDFAFGHSVGAGIQAYLVTGNKTQSLFAAFMAWNIDLFLSHEKKMKGSTYAHLAVEKFIQFWDTSFADEWEVATFNGRPAAELTFVIDTENGSYHVGHIDIILRHKVSGRYMVLELKTTAMRNPDEAMYANSDQGLSYGIVLDSIAQGESKAASYEVLYIAYSSTERSFTPFPFTKDNAQRADWLQSLLLDQATVATWKKLGFFPKNGDACWKFNKRCQHFGVCDMRSYNEGELAVFNPATMEWPEKPDFIFTLSELMERGKMEEELGVE